MIIAPTLRCQVDSVTETVIKRLVAKEAPGVTAALGWRDRHNVEALEVANSKGYSRFVHFAHPKLL
jgi:hypothetical protein